MPDDSHRVVNLAALAYKEGKFDEALRLYLLARQTEGSTPKLSYNVALCYFRLRDYTQALKALQEVIERGAQEHPELSVGGAQDGVELRSVGNSAVLIKTRLIECFNLKARARARERRCSSSLAVMTLPRLRGRTASLFLPCGRADDCSLTALSRLGSTFS